MSSLADLPELVGFFSYSREDDVGAFGALSALRDRIQHELRAQLGRTAKTFRIWQDKEAIPSGTLWETEIKNAVGQAAFFIPIITPTVVSSPFCRFELEAFLAREGELGRDDLVFPILYIDVPALEEDARRKNDPVLSLIAERQYVDWRRLRHKDVRTAEAGESVELFCRDIRDALRRSWISPEERNQLEAEAALQQADAERRRQELETKRRDEEARRRESEVEQHRIAEAEATRHREEQARKEAEAEQQKAAAERHRAGEGPLRSEAEAKVRAEAQERRGLRRSQSRPLWPPSRPVLTASSLIGLVVLAGIGTWLSESPTSIPVAPAPPSQVTPALAPATPGPAPAAPLPQAPNASLSAAREQALKPGETFQECTKCPVMKVVPAGRFTMGSPASEWGRQASEGPQHTVTIAAQFAVERYELTFDEWDACVAGGGCNDYKPFGGGVREPVNHVSWNDAKAYIAWLSKTTGGSYRLLSEAEYEYATRAGTTTAYPWGNDIGSDNTTCNGCGRVGIAPVGSFAPNGFGLYDMVGNVSEWTEDCWHNDYTGAPTDGSAWTSRDCSYRVVRGGAFFLTPDMVRSASRLRNATAIRSYSQGFRAARTLLAR